MGVYANNKATGLSIPLHLRQSYRSLGTNWQRLSSGMRINTSADDPAGSAVANQLRADVVSAQQGIRNAQDGISYLQTADGALSIVSDHLAYMKELNIQMGTDTYSPNQKRIMKAQLLSIADETARIMRSVKFNGSNVLDRNGAVVFNAGGGYTIRFEMADAGLSAFTSELLDNPEGLRGVVENAIQKVAEYRGHIGAKMKELAQAKHVKEVETENSLAAESRIADTNYARETASQTSNLIISQASIAMQAHSNEMAQMALGLLN